MQAIIFIESGAVGAVQLIVDIILIALAIFIFMGPTWIAMYRKHHQTGPIVAVNMLLGCTFIGWVVAFAWSLSAIPDSSGDKNKLTQSTPS